MCLLWQKWIAEKARGSWTLFFMLEKRRNERKTRNGEEDKNGTNCNAMAKCLSNTASKHTKKKIKLCRTITLTLTLVQFHRWIVADDEKKIIKRKLQKKYSRYGKKTPLVLTFRRSMLMHIYAHPHNKHKHIECVPWLTAYEETLITIYRDLHHDVVAAAVAHLRTFMYKTRMHHNIDT